jgi:predicted Ser/Thr protein kinase
MIGQRIGKYRIIEPLGRGTTGIVYKAVDDSLDREVAIKIVNPDIVDSEIMMRFRSEATILARLHHPDIASIYELVHWKSDLLMVMEFVRGETLDRLSRRLGPLPPDRAAYLTDKILAALEHAHRAGVVHRDVKPANVMMTDVGGVKIMDFGIARMTGGERVTPDGGMLGTPAYMAPEQVLGAPIDGRADLYSVGVILYRLLTAALPYKADNAIGMMQKQMSEAPSTLAIYRQGLPDWCETIVQRALAKSPSDRFQTAGEFREALGRATGTMATIDLAKAFAFEQAEHIVPASGELPATQPDATIVLERGRFGWMRSRFAIVAAVIAVVAYLAIIRPAIRLLPPVPMITAAPAAFPALVFETNALVGSGSRQQDRDAQFLMADGRITVVPNDDPQNPLRSVSYDDVISVTYSHGPDPIWNSPEGPTPVVRVRRSGLAMIGVLVERHWISLQIDAEDQFIVLRFSDGLVDSVLAALEERTGRTAERVGARAR